MRAPAKNQFTHSHVVGGDGPVAFECSSDIAKWPWLALHPFDPIVVQTINYWASVETGEARGTFDPTKWSALVQTEWECGADSAGHAVRGVSDVVGTEAEPRFELKFYDASDALVYRMSGKGVVFQNRDFEGWRAKAKQKITEPMDAADFDYAPCASVGVATQKESFVSPLINGAAPSAHALITASNGFIPDHPYHSGSGDHVNANHLADIGNQFAHLVTGWPALTITSGEISFNRYVELGQIFTVNLIEHDTEGETVAMEVHQADRLCSQIKLTYRIGEQSG